MLRVGIQNVTQLGGRADFYVLLFEVAYSYLAWRDFWRLIRSSSEDLRQSRACSSFSKTSRGLFTDSSFWRVKQSAPQTAVTAKTSPRTLARKNWQSHHNNSQSHTSFFTRELLTKNNMIVVPYPHPAFLYFPD
jgi:hypothetical protein